MSVDLGRAHKVVTRAETRDGDETVTLDYEGRFLRRKRLITDAGATVLVDLTEVTNLNQGDALLLENGAQVVIRAASEAVMKITGENLTRLAWHIGNRHTPCQIESDHLVIRHDHVLEGMIKGLGGQVAAISAPFLPEGGAYGHGRTMGHSHGDHTHDDHTHAHA